MSCPACELRGRAAEAREPLDSVYQRFPEAAECRDGREAKALLHALAGATPSP